MNKYEQLNQNRHGSISNVASTANSRRGTAIISKSNNCSSDLPYVGTGGSGTARGGKAVQDGVTGYIRLKESHINQHLTNSHNNNSNAGKRQRLILTGAQDLSGGASIELGASQCERLSDILKVDNVRLSHAREKPQSLTGTATPTVFKKING